MKNGPHALQGYPDAGSPSLGYVSAQRSKQFFNIRPWDVGPDRMFQNPFKRLALLLIHGYMISLVDTVSRGS
jgi:hypothetical protein